MQSINKRLVVAALAAALASPAWSASLEFVPAASSLAQGSNAAVDIVVSGLAAGEQVATFDLVVNFDPAILGMASYTLGNQLGNAADAIDFSAGAVGTGQFNLGQVSLLWDLSTQPGSFTLASLSFSGLAAGTSTLSFSDVTLGDAWGAAISPSLSTADLTVTPVPEPGSYAMLLAGLGLMGSIVRRRSMSI